jgi:four helix bundle protein
MARLREETLQRVETFADRVVDVAEALQKQRRFSRVVDQLAESGTSVGANFFEANHALTTRDFVKTVGIAVKELSETKFWLRLIVRRGWFKPVRLARLLAETDELLAIFNAMIVRSRRGLTHKK